MNAVMREYILKGVFLGLWAYLALVQPAPEAFWRAAGVTAAGLVLGVIAGAVQQLLRGFRPAANPGGFALLTLLDSPFLIYLGLVGGLAVGALAERPPAGSTPVRDWLGYAAVVGAVLGFGLYQLSQVKGTLWRFVLAVVAGGLLVALALSYLDDLPQFAEKAAQQQFAWQLLVGLPFFYVLVFCGEAEESEAEIGALCAGLGIGLFLLRLSSNLPEYGDKLIFLVPLALYYVYATQVLPHLRVFKHALRGYGYLYLRRVPEALVSFGRAVTLERQLPPKKRGTLAANGLLELHRRLDVSKLDDRTANLLNYDFLLSVVTGHLLGDRPPTAGEREEALKSLDAIDRRKPDLAPRADYLRAVAYTHGKQFDAAADVLRKLLDPETVYAGALRDKVLFPAWHLALRLHPEVVKRLGSGELAKPGRRVEAIRAVERQLAESPADGVALELKRDLYSGLTEPEFAAAASGANGPPPEINYDTLEQMGLSLVDAAEPEQRDRGMAFLRIAARGLPHRGPGMFARLAELATAAGKTDEARGYLEQVKRVGLAVGPKNLPPDQRELYVSTLKRLSDAAAARSDFATAAADLRLFIEAGTEDVETLRRLAELNEKSGDVLNALLVTERALLYAKKDPDLLKKKESYYFSVDVDRVAAVKDKVASWFDVAYCTKTAKAVADQKEPDLDALDWGLHLARLARVVAPASQVALLLEARLRLRKGERAIGLELLEDLREMKRGSGDDEDAWYAGVKLLGDLYLDEISRPDLAVGCYKDYREYQRSGADTLYRLGLAYEATGDVPNAIQSYESVTAYTGHPKYWDATEAVRRLKSAS